VVLGGHSKTLSQKNRQQADSFARGMAESIQQIPKERRQTIAGLTQELNARQIPTAKGGRWHRQSVYRLLARYSKLGVRFI